MLAFNFYVRSRPLFRHVFQLANSYCSSSRLKSILNKTARSGEMHTAMAAYYKLKEKGHVDLPVINTLLHVCQIAKDVQYVDEVVAAARSLPRTDDALSSKLIMCLITFGKLSEALELYKKLSSEGVKLRVGAIEALAKAILAQNKLNEVVPLIEGLEEKDAKLEPQLAQDILTAALDDKEETGRQVFRAVVKLYNSLMTPVPANVIDPIVKWIERMMNGAVSTKRVAIGPRFRCPHCQKRLNHGIESEQYQKLLQHIESSLQSEVRSVSSSTELVDDFCLLLERERPFYAVVDGLNMAYIGGNFNINFLIRVIKKLSANGKVLVIARSHLAKDLGCRESAVSLSELIDIYRRRNVHLFFTKNTWADDLYFLYGSFYSGPNTLFVSSDTMGTHANKMTKELSHAFRQWLATHQVKYEYNLVFPRAIPIIHQDTQSWHIPVIDTSSEPSTSDISYWLCVTAN